MKCFDLEDDLALLLSGSIDELAWESDLLQVGLESQLLNFRSVIFYQLTS